MSQQDLRVIILERLLNNYGPLLTVDNVAEELGLNREAFYARRARGRTGGMPAPLSGVVPHQYRAVELARWFAGETDALPPPPPDPDPDRVRRRPGRPRNAPGGGTGRARARG